MTILFFMLSFWIVLIVVPTLKCAGELKVTCSFCDLSFLLSYLLPTNDVCQTSHPASPSSSFSPPCLSSHSSQSRCPSWSEEAQVSKVQRVQGSWHLCTNSPVHTADWVYRADRTSLWGKTPATRHETWLLAMICYLDCVRSANSKGYKNITVVILKLQYSCRILKC